MMNWTEWFYHENLKRLEKYRGILNRKTAILAGTGPSLDETPFEYVRGHTLMVVNTFFFLTEKFNVEPNFACISDYRTYEQSAYDGLVKMGKPLFLSHSAAIRHLKIRRSMYGDDNPKTWNIPEGSPILTSLSLDNMLCGKYENTGIFSSDVTKPNMVGGTVIIDNGLQLLGFMDAGEVIMIGCDWKWDDEKKHAAGAENSYYFQGVPSTTNSVMDAFKKCKKAYEAEGRRIYNASPITANNVIDRINLRDVIWND